MKESMDRLGLLPYLFLGAGLLVLGMLAANHIVDNFWPFDVARLDLVRATALDRVDATSILDAGNNEIILAFLASVMVAATGLILPVVFFLNDRFGGEETSTSLLVIVRQATFFGLWLAFCIWLQMNRSLGIMIAGLVALVLAMFEILLQVRGRAAGLGR